MAKTVRDAKLDNPTAREKLKQRGKPYYKSIDTGLHLGYRKNKNSGQWLGRIYAGNRGYEFVRIANADDRQAADGKTVLTYSQAQAKLRELAEARRQPLSAQGPLTVSQALDVYLERLEAEHSKGVRDARSRADNHIRPKLGNVLVADLTREMISKWLKGLSEQPRYVRGKKGKPPRSLVKANTDDEKRRRKASANRIRTILVAALNQAFQDGLVRSDAAWRAVKPFREVDTARVRYFSTDEIRRLVNAACGDFRLLVNAALFTGCRYGELTRLRVEDFNPDAWTVYVAQSKSGKARHVVLTHEGQIFFSQLAAGRASGELLLRRDSGSVWGPSHQIKPMAEACDAANIPRAGFHIIRHTAASHNVMNGVPLPVVAKNLGHADTRMTEKHYAHLAPNYVAETIRKFAPSFGLVQPTNVKPIERGRAAK